MKSSARPGLHKVFVLLSGYLVYGVTIGFYYALGALFTVIMDTFNASRAETSVIQSMYSVFLMGGGIVHGRVTSLIGPVKGSVLGSLVTSVGLIVSFWSTSLPFLIATSAVTACGCGLCFVASTVGIRQHFSGKSGVMALALISSSSGTFGVALTYTLRYLSDKYGLKGALLIMGGVQLNGAVLSLLWSNPPKTNNTINKEQEPDTHDSDRARDIRNIPKGDQRAGEQFTGDISSVTTSVSAHRPKTFSNDARIEAKPECFVNDGYISNSYSAGGIPNEAKSVEPDDVTLETGKAITDDQTSTKTSFPGPEQPTCVDARQKPHTLTAMVKVKHILGLPSYTCTLVALLMCVNCAQMYVTFIVDMFLDAGFSETEGSAALAIINVASIFGRFSPALLVRCSFYSPFILPIATGALCSVAMALFTVATNLVFMLSLCVVLGFTIGVYVSVVVVAISELVAPVYLAEAVGLMLTSVGACNLIVGPFTGFLRDSGVSYVKSYIISATFNGLGTLMLLCAYRFHNRQRNPTRRKQSVVFYMTRM